jgi:hypothetical protein
MMSILPSAEICPPYIINNQLHSQNGIEPTIKEAVTSFFEGLATNITTTIAIGITLDPTPH